jgi:kinesin family protein 5
LEVGGTCRAGGVGYVRQTCVNSRSCSSEEAICIPNAIDTCEEHDTCQPRIEGLRGDLESRPQTPTVVGLDKDERDEFLKRENELSDQLASKESALVAADKLVSELREELTFLKEQETTVSKVSCAVS